MNENISIFYIMMGIIIISYDSKCKEELFLEGWKITSHSFFYIGTLLTKFYSLENTYCDEDSFKRRPFISQMIFFLERNFDEIGKKFKIK
jgi:hypothetical protein